jgi:hypothetical protein
MQSLMPPRVIQGYFPTGAPRLPATAAPHVAAALQPKTAQAHPAQPRNAIQRLPNGTATPLPPHLEPGAGAGQPLPAVVQRKMEQLFGRSFADVRIHIAPQAAAIGAHAFTSGSHIYFAPGRANFETAEGQRLLAHELGHVVQQRSGRVPNPLAPHAAVIQDHALDAEASRMAARAAQQPATPRVPLPPAARPAPFAPVQRKTGGVIQLIKYKEAQAALTKDEMILLDTWLTARSPGQGSSQQDTDSLGKTMLLEGVPSVAALREILGLYDRHVRRAKQHDNSYETAVIDALYDHVSKSRILTTYATSQLSKQDITGAVRFLDDDAFRTSSYGEQLSLNPTMDPQHQSYKGGSTNWSFKVAHGRRTDQTLAFEHGGTIHLRAGDAAMHIAIHELIHKVSAQGMAALGPVLNEGFTEKIAREVCTERNVGLEGDFYTQHRSVVQTFLNLYGLTNEAQWMAVYFTNSATLRNLLAADLGTGLQTFLANKDAAQAVTIFKAQRELEQQRQVATGVLLETTLQNYVIIPAALGTNGHTLEWGVRDALDKYDKATKWSKSAETTNAIGVLTGVLNTHAHLYAAVRWYLRHNIQRPQTVVVGIKLNSGSRFDTLLSTAYNAWL